MKLLRRIAAPITALTLALSVAGPATAATLTPAQVAGNATLSTVTEGTTPGLDVNWRDKLDGDRVVEMYADSPAMNGRIVPLFVIKAADANRPTIYLLNGGDGGEGNANWVMQTDVIDFYKDKNVNVVIPMAGAFSYYTDWLSPAENLGGVQKWETFLTKELPTNLEKKLKASNKRAIAGLSMSATSALLLAEHNPGFYDATGSFSGCAATSTPVEYGYLNLTLQRGGATAAQMWGPQGSATNRWNDALLNAEKLRGTEVYVSNGSGLAGYWDLPSSPRFKGAPPAAVAAGVAVVTVEGGAIEAATNVCTHNLKAKLKKLNIPADFNMRHTGTHSWGWWQDDLRESWKTFNRAFKA